MQLARCAELTQAASMNYDLPRRIPVRLPSQDRSTTNAKCDQDTDECRHDTRARSLSARMLALTKSAVETYKDRKRSARSFNMHFGTAGATCVGLLRGLPTPEASRGPAHWSVIASPEGWGFKIDCGPPCPNSSSPMARPARSRLRSARSPISASFFTSFKKLDCGRVVIPATHRVA